VTFDETIAKSVELDRHLAKSVENPMADLGATKLMGELGGLFEDVRKTLEEAKLGIAGAASELMSEVKDLKVVETALRAETKSVRDFKTKLLGNAIAGENEGQPQ
jgi:hypothetical protein